MSSNPKLLDYTITSDIVISLKLQTANVTAEVSFCLHRLRLMLTPKKEGDFGELCISFAEYSQHKDMDKFNFKAEIVRVDESETLSLENKYELQLSNYGRRNASLRKVVPNCWKVPQRYLVDVSHGYLSLNNTVTIRITVTYRSPESIARSQQTVTRKRRRSLTADLQKQLQSEHCADVTLQVGNTQLKAHVNILSARSDMFKAMFENDLRERNDHNVIIDNFNVEVIKAMLKFFYTDSISDNAMSKHCEELMNATVFYQSTGLMDYCEECMCDLVTENNVFRCAALADEKKLLLLKAATVKFIANNGQAILGNIQREARQA